MNSNQTNRRDTAIALLALGALGVPSPSIAQVQKSGPSRRIGFLSLRAEPKTPVAQRPLVVALAKLGWVQGENLVLERAYADLKAERLPELAKDLLRKRVEVIMTADSEATIAAARATQTIPIVFFNADWPVEQELINSYARPGRNLTGTAYYTGVEGATKRFQYLREIAPAAKRLALLRPSIVTETLSGRRFDLGEMLDAGARALGFELRVHDIVNPQDIDTALGALSAWRADALGGGGVHVTTARQKIADFALRYRLPSAFTIRSIVEAGGLLSYAAPQSELDQLFQHWVAYADRILRGARPGDLPVHQPKKFELVINLKTARALGLTVPQPLLLRADEVIQ